MAETPHHSQGPDAEPLLSTMLSESPELVAIVEQFVRGLPERMEAIQDALRQQSFDRIERLAHQLRSAGNSHGYAELTRAAGGLEQAAHAHAVDELTAKVHDMASLVERIRAGLQQDE